MNSIHQDGVNVKFPYAKKAQKLSQDDTLHLSSQFLDALHRGGTFRFLQDIGKRRRSVWFATDEPVSVPNRWRSGHNVYFGVNPTNAVVTDEDRKRYAGKTDDEIAQYVGSKNATIAGINVLYAEFDAKDFAQPSEEQIQAHFAALRNDPAKSKSSDKALLNEATTAARKTVFLTNPSHYIDLALTHVNALSVRPSVVVYSGGGYHCYWLLADTYMIAGDDAAFKYATFLQDAWVKYVGGDTGAKDLRRVLRVPGLRNYKKDYAPDFPLVEFVHYDLERRYPLAALAALLPEPEAAQPSPATKGGPVARRVAGDIEPQREHSSFVYRVMAAYNDRHDVGSALEGCGYTLAGNGRYSRPGEPDSKGVAILDGKAYVHSSNDPLFEVCGNHRLSAFDVSVHWDFGGNYEAAAAALAPGLGVFSQAGIDHARLIAQFADWSEIVPLERQSQNGYMTAQTDRLLFSNLVDICEERRCVAGLTVGLRQLAADTNSEGVPVSLCSPETVRKWLDRLNGTVLSTEDVDGRTVISLNTEAITALAGSVAHRSDTLNNQDVCSKVSILCATEPTLHETTTGAYHERKADDAFMRGRSAPVRDQIRSNINALCAKDERFAAAARSHDKAKESRPQTVGEWSALMGADNLAVWCELKQQACEEFLPALGTYGLLVLAELADNPGANRREIAKRRGLKASSVARSLVKLAAWGLVEVEQSGANTSKLYSIAGELENVWRIVDERTPEAMTYTIGVRRRDKQLELAQEFKARGAATAIDEESERKARRQLAKIEKKRRATLAAVHPDMHKAEIERTIQETNARGARRTAQPSPFADLRVSRMATDNDPKIPVESAAATMIAGGYHDRAGAYLAARYAGYSKEDAQRIESLILLHGGPVEYTDLVIDDELLIQSLENANRPLSPLEQSSLEDARRRVAGEPIPLPANLWRSGLSLADALRLQRELAAQYQKPRVGAENGTYYVRAADWQALAHA